MEALQLDVGSLPRLTRHTYRIEMLHMALWGGVGAMLEGGIAAVIIAKTFHGSPFQISVVRATPVVCNMLSIAWGMLAATRPKIPLLMIGCGGAAAAMAGVALVPADIAWGGWLFTLQLVLARIFLSGTATLRTAIWKANYPTRVRGRLAGRLQLQGSLSRLVTLYLSCWVLDLHPARTNLWVPRFLVEWLQPGPQPRPLARAGPAGPMGRARGLPLALPRPGDRGRRGHPAAQVHPRPRGQLLAPDAQRGGTRPDRAADPRPGALQPDGCADTHRADSADDGDPPAGQGLPRLPDRADVQRGGQPADRPHPGADFRQPV